MVNVGVQYFLGAIALCGGAIIHNFEVNNILNVADTVEYGKRLSKLNRLMAENATGLVMGATLAGAFVATIAIMSIPVVGPFLALAAGGYLAYDYLKVKKLKKSINAESEASDIV